MNPNKITVFGPPGTGKTTYLMNLLEEAVAKVPLEEIAFVSFTKKSVGEGIQRAANLLGFEVHQKPPFFGTIHALCFAALHLRRENILNKNDYKKLSEELGMKFKGYYTYDYTSPDDLYLHVLQMFSHNRAYADKMLGDLVSENALAEVSTQLNAMKIAKVRMDFTDMLTGYMKHGESLPVRIAFVDEAQDLTPLQWDVVNKLFNNAETIYAAGDDDQSIYAWAGADVKRFLDFSDEIVLLKKSYRMPKIIHKLAGRLVRDIKIRQVKTLTPNDNRGEIDYVGNFSHVTLEGGELVLARTNYLLQEIGHFLLEKGVLFNLKGKLSVRFDILHAITAYEEYCAGADKVDPVHAINFNNIDRNLHWSQTLKLSPFKIKYYQKMLASKAYRKKPIELETYHGSKGTENEHVILSYELTKRVHDAFRLESDFELRCLYVALTRTKNKLTVLTPTRKRHYPPKYITIGKYDDN